MKSETKSRFFSGSRYGLTVLAAVSILWGCGPRQVADAGFGFARTEFLDAMQVEPTRLPAGHLGYVLYYINPAKDCPTCIRQLTAMNSVLRAYPEILIANVQRGADASQVFLPFVEEADLPGLRLKDLDGTLMRQLSLPDEPLLLVLDHELKLVNLYRDRDVALLETPEHTHRLLQSL